MKNKKIYFVFILVFAIATTSVSSSIGVTIKNDTIIMKGNNIYFKVSTFNPIIEDPLIQEELTIEEQESQYFIIQLDGPIHKSEIDALNAAEATLLEYIPDYAYIAKIDQLDLPALRQLSFVSWIGAYHPGFKISDELYDVVDQVEINVKVFEEPGNPTKVQNAIKALGGDILDVVIETGIFHVRIDAAYIEDISFIPEVEWIEISGEKKLSMDKLRDLTGATTLHTNGYDGSGIVGEIKDAGYDRNHPEFEDQILAEDGSVSHHAHGTCTFGIVFAKGLNVRAEGMIPAAQGVFCDWGVGRYQSIQNLVNNWNGVFQSNSWSQGDNWNGGYNSYSQSNDQAVYDFDVSMLYSAGNYGDINMRISYDSNGKNVICVGGINHYDTLDRNDDQWIEASDGPSADGRIKPDLSAAYDYIFTTDSLGSLGYSGGDYTEYFGGTSGAAPITAGATGLVYDMYKDNHWDNNPGGDNPHAATVKALLINHAYQYPLSQIGRYKQGWGFVDIGAVYEASDDLIVNEEYSLSTGQSESWSVTASSGTPLKITLVWTDVPGTTSSSKHLKNDLSLKITDPNNNVYWGNYDLINSLWSSSGGSEDHTNNVENVFIQNPLNGEYTVEVIAYNIPEPVANPEQDFALIISGSDTAPPQILTYNPTSYDFGNMLEGQTDSTSFDIWNSGTDTLTYSLSESCSWVSVNPSSGDSTGEHDTISVTVDTTGLSEGVYHCDIDISSNGGSGIYSFDLEVVSSGSENLDQEQEKSGFFYLIYNTRWVGQSFIPTLNELSKVELLVGKSGTPPGNIVVSIRSSLTGGDLASISISSDDILSGVDWVEFDFDDIDVTPGETYYIVVHTTGGSSSNCYLWGYGLYTPYIDGAFQFSLNGGIIWTEYILYDFCFRTYAPSSEPPIPVLSYNPTSNDFGDMLSGESGSTSFNVWNSGTGVLIYSLSESCGWVSVSPSGGDSSGEYDSIDVVVDTTGLSSGVYHCDIDISSDGGSGVFGVDLVVVAPVPVLSFSPVSYDFGSMLEGVVDSTSFDIWNSGTGTLTYSLIESCDWLSVNPAGGDSTGEHDTIDVVVDSTGLSEGIYHCDIDLSSNGGSGLFSVDLEVVTPAPVLSYSPISHDFGDMLEGDTDSSVFEIWNGGTDILTYSVSESCSWVSVSPTDGDSSGEHDTITVTVDTTGLSIDVYHCDISISSDGGSGVFSVDLVVVAPVPVLSFSPVSYDFGSMLEGVVDSTSFDIWNSGTGTLTYSLIESCDWLSVNPAGGDSTGEHDTIDVVVDSTGLSEGIYHCDIDLSSNGGSGLFSVDLVVVPGISENLDQEQDKSGYFYLIYNSRWLGQSFIPTLDKLSKVELLVGKSGVPPSDIVVSIRSSLTGGDLGSVSLSSVSIPSGVDWVEFDFDDIDVTPGNIYYIVVRTNGGSTSNCYLWSYGFYTPYTDGVFHLSLNSGSSWLPFSSYDFCFRTYGPGEAPPIPTLTYNPTSFDFGSMLEGVVDSTSFDVWNSGTGVLTYGLSESCGWVSVSPAGGDSTGEHDTIDVVVDTTGLSEGSYHCDIDISSNGGSGLFSVDLEVVTPAPVLSYNPISHDFGDMLEGETDSSVFEIWNGGTDTLTYSLSESCGWVSVSPPSGDSTGEHDAITATVDTTGLSLGAYHCDIGISSNGGNDVFSIDVNVIPEAADSLDQEQSINTNVFLLFLNRFAAQSFTPELDVLTRVELYVQQLGSPTDDLVVSIRDDLYGVDLTSISVPAGDIPTSLGWVEFDFSDLSVIPGNTYFIVMQTSDGSISQNYKISYASGNPYGYGSFWFSSDSGSSWREFSSYDLTFRTYGL